jgi:hypothetical protein
MPAAETFTGATGGYLPIPTANEVQDREAAGACPVCDMRAKGCYCRWCEACRRYWLALRSSLRDPEAEHHHGIKGEACAPCAARSRS